MPSPAGNAEVPLTLFGGLNTELRPTDLPAGLSPACSDVAFLPGSVFTRPAFTRATALPTTAQVVYAASFTRPSGAVSLFQLTADGAMWVDGSQIGQTGAGNRALTFCSFGKMYLTLSDGLHGADVPLQYTPEGWLDRISQDGPGAGPTFTATQVAADQFPISTITQPAQHVWNYAYLLRSTGPGSTTPGSVITIYYADHTAGASVDNDLVTAFNSGVPVYLYLNFEGPAEYGPHIVQLQSAPSGAASPPGQPHQFYYFTFADPEQVIDYTLWAGSGHPGYTITYQRTQATLTTSNPVPGVTVGTEITVSEASVTQYDSTWAVLATPNSAQMNITQTSVTAGTATYSYILITGSAPTAGQSVNVTNTLNAGGTLNVTNGVIATVGAGIFTINGFGSGTSAPAAEAGLAVTAGTQFTFEPATPYIGTTTSPIFGSSTGGYLVFSASAAVVTPGTRQGVVIFLTRTGYLTAPSPMVKFTVPENSNAIAVTNLPIGPSNVIARYLAFTGANGGNFFYLPQAPLIDGVVNGTSTIVNDNTTTATTVYFGDASLLSATAIDIPGNNLFNQVVLGPCLGVYAYRSRLFAWGERNKTQNLLNMGFEGGYVASAPAAPLGWTVLGSNGTLTGAGVDYGMGFQFTDGITSISQTVFQDSYGIAILQPLTQYTFRLWATGPGNVQATINSPSQGVLATATVAIGGGFHEARFSSALPVTIPSDAVLTISAPSASAETPVLIDEAMVYPTLDPFVTYARASYVDNPEAFDGVTGIFGPSDDPRPVMGMQERRGTLNILTLGPEGCLYESEDTPSAEPSNWTIRRVAAKCGLTSVWGIADFEDWFCWSSDTGLRIYDGGTVDKMSQEVETLWDSINPGARQLTVLANDPYTRRLYILAATGEANATNAFWVMDYRELNSAAELSGAAPLRVSYTGKVITTDLTRKWTTWSAAMNYAAMIAQANGAAAMTFCGGTGGALSDPLYGATYTLQEGVISGIDADYGPFWENSSYTTFFFLPQDMAQSMGLGMHRLLHDFLTLNCAGVGYVYVMPLLNEVGNQGVATRAVPVSATGDLEFGLRDGAERIAYRIACQPAAQLPAAPTAPAGFLLTNLALSLCTHPFSPVKGWNKG